jgi:hypothetical protein
LTGAGFLASVVKKPACSPATGIGVSVLVARTSAAALAFLDLRAGFGDCIASSRR